MNSGMKVRWDWAAQKLVSEGAQHYPGFVRHVAGKVSAEMRFSRNGTTGCSHGPEPVERVGRPALARPGRTGLT